MNNRDDKKSVDLNNMASGGHYDEGNDTMDLDDSIGNSEEGSEQSLHQGEQQSGHFEKRHGGGPRRPGANNGPRGPRSAGGGRNNNRRHGAGQGQQGQNGPSRRGPSQEGAERFGHSPRPRRFDRKNFNGPNNNQRRPDFVKTERTEIKIKTFIAEGSDLDELKRNALVHLNIHDASLLDYKVLEEGKRSFILFGAKSGKYEFFVKPEYKALARDFLSNIFKLAGLNLDLSVDLLSNEEEKLLKIDIIGEDEEMLLTNDSDLLASFDHCLRRFLGHLVPLEQDLRIQLSCNGSINSREEKLQQLAQKMKDKVLDQKAPVVLRPMNPTERRIIHQFLDKDESVRTVSLGDGHYKRIRIESLN